MSCDLQQAADACLSMAYEYTSLRACVADQHPGLLSADPMLSMLQTQINALELAFNARLVEIADGKDRDD